MTFGKKTGVSKVFKEEQLLLSRFKRREMYAGKKMKGNKFLLAACLVLGSCFSKSTMMSQQTFDDVQIGTRVDAIVKENGEPYSIETKNGMEEYRYVERVTDGNTLVYENHFVLFVKGGVVVAKTVSQERLPAFDLMYQDDPNHHQYP